MNSAAKFVSSLIIASLLAPMAAFAQTDSRGGPFFDSDASSSYGGGDVTLCYRNETITVSARRAARLIAQGATTGACTPPGTLTITKNTTGGDDTFRFTSTNANLKDFSIVTHRGTGSATFTLPRGTYTITERTQRNWSQVSNTCSAVVVNSGGNASCTIVNQAAPGSISGTVYEDLTGRGSGFRNPLNRRSGVTVYIDSNNNGRLDGGEPSTVSNGIGAYSFTGLVPNAQYHVREVVPTNYTQTYPATRAYLEYIHPGENATGDDFANYLPTRGHHWYDSLI